MYIGMAKIPQAGTNSTAGCANSSCYDTSEGILNGLGWTGLSPLHLYPAGVNSGHLLNVQALNDEGVISR